MSAERESIKPDARTLRAWDAVMTVRSSAGQLEPVVAAAIDTIVDMYGEEDLARVPSLDRAFTVLVGTLTSMKSAREILGWLEATPSLPPDGTLQ